MAIWLHETAVNLRTNAWLAIGVNRGNLVDLKRAKRLHDGTLGSAHSLILPLFSEWLRALLMISTQRGADGMFGGSRLRIEDDKGSGEGIWLSSFRHRFKALQTVAARTGKHYIMMSRSNEERLRCQIRT